MTTQSYLFNHADDLKAPLLEEQMVQADLDRLRRQQQDPYGRRRAREAHARDIDMVRMQASNNGEEWAR